MRAYHYLFLLVATLAVLLLVGGQQAQASESREGAALNGTGPHIRSLEHPETVHQEELSRVTFRFDTQPLNLTSENLSLQVEWTRTPYHDQAEKAAAEMDKLAKKDREGKLEGSRGEDDEEDEGDEDDEKDEREQVEQKYELKWSLLAAQITRNVSTGRFEFSLAGEEVHPGYYLFRVRVGNLSANDTPLAWFYSRHPLLVLAPEGEEVEVKLKIITLPDYATQTLYFQVRYEGPFLENPVVYILAPHLGLTDLRVNITGVMSDEGGELRGNVSFGGLPIPAGTYGLTLKAVDGANRNVTLTTHFEIKAFSAEKEERKEVHSETGRSHIELEVKGKVTDGRLSLEELEINPHNAPDAAKLLQKYKEHLAPGKLKEIGRYLSLEPSPEVRQQMKNATLRFFVNETDLDPEGKPLGQRVHGLRIFYYNETSQEWELVENSGYDRLHRLVRANVTHFSLYGLFGANVAPTALADPSSITVKAGRTFTLEGEGTDLDGQIVEWAWDLDGDGNYEVVSNISGQVSHTYSQPGYYVAKLRVADEEGATSFDQVSIQVTDEEDSTDLPLPLWVTLAAVGLSLALVVGFRRAPRGP